MISSCAKVVQCSWPVCRGALASWLRAAIRRENRLERLTRVDRTSETTSRQPANAVRRRGTSRTWSVGDRLMHSSFGEGHVTHLFGSGEKVSIAVKFEGMGPKILDPRLAPIQPL